MNILRTAAKIVLGIAVAGILLTPFTQTGGYIAVLLLIVFRICLWILGPLDESDDGVSIPNDNAGDRPDQSAWL